MRLRSHLGMAERFKASQTKSDAAEIQAAPPLKTLCNFSVVCLNVPNLVQTVYQQASLMRRQFFKFCRHHLEFFGFHRSTYLVDWYGDSIDLYLTVT